MSIDDVSVLTWGPKVTDSKNISLTQEDEEQCWLKQLRIEVLRRADSYASAVSEYQKKKSEAVLLQQNDTAAIVEVRNLLLQGISEISQDVPDYEIAVNKSSLPFALSEQTIVYGQTQSVRPGDEEV